MILTAETDTFKRSASSSQSASLHGRLRASRQPHLGRTVVFARDAVPAGAWHRTDYNLYRAIVFLYFHSFHGLPLQTIPPGIRFAGRDLSPLKPSEFTRECRPG